MYSVIIVLLLLILGAFGLSPDVKNGGRSNLRRPARDIIKEEPRTKSEAIAVGYLEKITGEKFPSVRPAWLIYKGRQLELDGYNEKAKIALEFQGPLHTKFYPRVESYSAYYERLLRDEFKKEQCKKHNVVLITLDVSLPPHHWKDYIQSRLADAGKSARPTHYIDIQHPVPYRNAHAEAEIGLFGLTPYTTKKE